MKTRFPIYAKLLFWFFVNLIALATAGWLVLRGQLRFSLFSEHSVTDRVERVASELVKELPLLPSPKWTAILQQYSERYGVDFFCYDVQGRMLGGPARLIPPDVHQRVVQGGRRGSQGRPPGPPGPPGPPRRPPRDDSPFDEREGPPPPRDDEPGHPPLPHLAERPEPAARFVIQTSSPHMYWVGIRIEDLHAEAPGYIIAGSGSPTGNGLYLDVKPFVWAGVGMLALSALIWLPFVRSLTRSVRAMRNATGKISEGDFTARVEGERRDELGELGDGINRMAVRLKGYVEGQKRFLGDVAHELCAPTARLQMSVAILEQRAPESERERLHDVREEVEHMSALVNELLQFSKASISSKTVTLQPVDVRSVAEKAIHREAGDITLAVAENTLALADPDLLQRALGNLIRNAIRYAGHAGPITISAQEDRDEVRITIDDAGPGIPAESLTKIFDPFYRLDVARARESGGVGLGLAIVKTCVESCEGTIAATNRSPSGLSVTITLKKP